MSNNSFNEPLVSILIPTYNRPDYFELALQSALKQTYQNIEIIIADGSTDMKTEEGIKAYLADKRIRYFHKADKNYEERIRMLMEMAKGDFVNYLLDDDIFHCEKIERMAGLMQLYPEVNLITSYRKVIDKNGDIMEDTFATQPISQQDLLFEGRNLGRHILLRQLNFLGELTTVLIRKSCVVLENIFRFFGQRICLDDVVWWLSLLIEGKVIYLAEAMSYFRVHRKQSSANLLLQVYGLEAWFQLIQGFYKRKIFLENEADYKKAYMIWRERVLHYKNHGIVSNEQSEEDRQQITTVMKQLEKYMVDGDKK